MTVPNENSRMDYVGDGAADEFDFTYKVTDEGDLVVETALISDPTQKSVLVLNTDYTVDGVGDDDGGSITLVAGALSALYSLSIRRVLELVQELELTDQGPYSPEAVERQFDRGIMTDQQQQEQIDRSFKMPPQISTAAFNPELPADLVTTPGGNLRVNSSGDGFIVATGDADSVPVSGYMATVLDDVDAASARTTLGFAGTGGKVQAANIEAGAVVAAGLASDAVTTAKILDDNVTPAKLSVAARQATYLYGASIVGTDAYAITLSPATAYGAGMKVYVRLDVTNTGGATLELNGLGAKTILDCEGYALVGGELRANSIQEFIYDGVNFRASNIIGQSEIWLYGGNGRGSTNTANRIYSTVAKNVGNAMTYASSAAAGASVTINIPGRYAISSVDVVTSAYDHGISVNSEQLTTGIASITAANRLAYALCSDAGDSYTPAVVPGIWLNAGDVIRPHSATSGGTTNDLVSFRIARIG